MIIEKFKSYRFILYKEELKRKQQLSFVSQLWISYSTHIFALHGLNDSLAQKASLLMTLPQAALSLGLVSVFEKVSDKAKLSGTSRLSFKKFE